MTQLPQSEWRQHSGLKRIIRALTVGDDVPFAVGGAVRDTLLGLPVSDIDLATKLHPDEVTRRLESAGIKAIPTGIDHGTITAVADTKNFEITTYRRDVATDGRRAVVAFADDYHEDAQRRDFTINALYANVESGEILDSVGGLDDLNTRHIRFIGSAAERIAEDHLRILRYFRFLARFGEQGVDKEAIAACRKGASSLKSLSRERVADELLKLLATHDPRFAIEQMLKAGIFPNILAEIDSNIESLMHHLVEREQAHEIAPSSIRRLFALLPKDAQIAEKITKKLRLSKKLQRALIDRNRAAAPDAETITTIAYHRGEEAARDIALIFAAPNDIRDCLNALGNWQKPIFPIKGGDLIAMGLKAGPIVAKTLAQVEQVWIAEGFPDAARVQELVRKLIAEEK